MDPEEPAALASLPLVELWRQLARRNIRTTGFKHELVARLREVMREEEEQAAARIEQGLDPQAAGPDGAVAASHEHASAAPPPAALPNPSTTTKRKRARLIVYPPPPVCIGPADVASAHASGGPTAPDPLYWASDGLHHASAGGEGAPSLYPHDLAYDSLITDHSGGLLASSNPASYYDYASGQFVTLPQLHGPSMADLYSHSGHSIPPSVTSTLASLPAGLSMPSGLTMPMARYGPSMGMSAPHPYHQQQEQLQQMQQLAQLQQLQQAQNRLVQHQQGMMLQQAPMQLLHGPAGLVWGGPAPLEPMLMMPAYSYQAPSPIPRPSDGPPPYYAAAAATTATASSAASYTAPASSASSYTAPASSASSYTAPASQHVLADPLVDTSANFGGGPDSDKGTSVVSARLE